MLRSKMFDHVTVFEVTNAALFWIRSIDDCELFAQMPFFVMIYQVIVRSDLLAMETTDQSNGVKLEWLAKRLLQML